MYAHIKMVNKYDKKKTKKSFKQKHAKGTKIFLKKKKKKGEKKPKTDIKIFLKKKKKKSVSIIEIVWSYHWMGISSHPHFPLLKESLYNSNCHFAKIRQTFFDYWMLRTLRFICQNQVSPIRFIGVLITGWLFSKAFQVISIAEDWNSTNICLHIKISYNNEIFIM